VPKHKRNIKLEIFDSLKQFFWNKPFLLLIISIITFNLFGKTDYNLLSSIFFIISDIIYGKYIIWKIDRPSLVYHIFAIILMIIFTLISFFKMIHDYEKMSFVFVLGVLLIFLFFVILSFTFFWFNKPSNKHKCLKWIWLVSSYLYFSFCLIIFFAFLYAIFNYTGNYLAVINDNINISSPWDYVYYSLGTYYSSSYGEIYPISAPLRLISSLEIIVGSVVHIILLGILISTYLNSKK